MDTCNANYSTAFLSANGDVAAFFQLPTCSITLRVTITYSLLTSELSWLGYIGIGSLGQISIPTYHLSIHEGDTSYVMTNFGDNSLVIEIQFIHDWNETVEQHTYTLLNTIGALGGFFTVLSGIYQLLFGSERMSAFGFVQRRARRSMMKGIKEIFPDLLEYEETARDRFMREYYIDDDLMIEDPKPSMLNRVAQSLRKLLIYLHLMNNPTNPSTGANGYSQLRK